MKATRCGTSNQCTSSWRMCAKLRSIFHVAVMTRAAAFRTCCSLSVVVLGAFSRAVRCHNLSDWSRIRGLVQLYFHIQAVRRAERNTCHCRYVLLKCKIQCTASSAFTLSIASVKCRIVKTQETCDDSGGSVVTLCQPTSAWSFQR